MFNLDDRIQEVKNLINEKANIKEMEKQFKKIPNKDELAKLKDEVNQWKGDLGRTLEQINENSKNMKELQSTMQTEVFKNTQEMNEKL